MKVSEEQYLAYFKRKVAEWLEDGPEEIVRVLSLWASRRNTEEEPRIEISDDFLDAEAYEALEEEKRK